MINQEEIDNQIIRRLTGDMSAEEQLAFDAQLHSNSEIRRQFEEMQSVWNMSAEAKTLQKFEQSRDASWIKIKTAINDRHVVKRGFAKRFMRVAAVLVPLMVLGVTVWMTAFNRTHEFTYTAMNVDTITLPDQTELILNARTTIEYFDRAGERRLRLAGMAHLHVARDEQRPFVVKAGDTKVRVLGTEFNVENIDGRNRVKVDVESGRVRVTSHDNKIELTANQSVTVENGRFVGTEVPADNSWVEGSLVFDNATIEEIAEKLLNYYPQICDVRIGGTHDTTRVTTKFVRQPLDEVIEELNIHFNRKITLSEGYLVISD